MALPRSRNARRVRSCLNLGLGFLLLCVASAANSANPTERAHADRPNVVLIFCDDLGYADIGAYGAKGYRTPNIDRLAKEGVRLTDFYVAQAVCSASRAALMTGCYPNRVGIKRALDHRANIGLAAGELTIAESLRTRGYATGVFGKWHLGHHPEFLPNQHGFDEYFGLPYSNDMWPFHPASKRAYPPLPLLEGERVLQLMPDQTRLTTWYTEKAVSFIERHRGGPFFLYLAHSMPHVPLFVSEKFHAQSGAGTFGDVLMEIDWSVGQVLAALERHGLEKETLVLFSSDNGPWLLYGDHAGSTGKLREGKGTVFEGGVRVPFLARWPGRIPAGSVCREPAMTIDLLPTLAALAGAPRPTQRIDGLDIWPLLNRPTEAKSPHEALYFYWDDELQAVRSGPWKLHFPHEYHQPGPFGSGGEPGKSRQGRIGLSLFNLERDPGETRNVARKFPEVVARLRELAEGARKDLGDSARGQRGTGVREPGRRAGG